MAASYRHRVYALLRLRHDPKIWLRRFPALRITLLCLLVEVAACRHWVNEDQFDLLVRANDVDIAHGRVIGGCALFWVAFDVRGKHPVQFRDLKIGITDDWIVRRLSLRFFDVLCPALVIASRINSHSHYLDVTPIKLWFDFRHVTEFRRADWSEVLRVREKNGPGITDPIVETDPAFGGFCLKIWCCIANFHTFFLRCCTTGKSSSSP